MGHQAGPTSPQQLNIAINFVTLALQHLPAYSSALQAPHTRSQITSLSYTPPFPPLTYHVIHQAPPGTHTPHTPQQEPREYAEYTTQQEPQQQEFHTPHQVLPQQDLCTLLHSFYPPETPHSPVTYPDLPASQLLHPPSPPPYYPLPPTASEAPTTITSNPWDHPSVPLPPHNPAPTRPRLYRYNPSYVQKSAVPMHTQRRQAHTQVSHLVPAHALVQAAPTQSHSFCTQHAYAEPDPSHTQHGEGEGGQSAPTDIPSPAACTESNLPDTLHVRGDGGGEGEEIEVLYRASPSSLHTQCAAPGLGNVRRERGEGAEERCRDDDVASGYAESGTGEAGVREKVVEEGRDRGGEREAMWEDMGLFDVEDLDEGGLYLLRGGRRGEGGGEEEEYGAVYVWVGRVFDVPREGLGEEGGRRERVERWVRDRRLGESGEEVRVEWEGLESEEFWGLFEAGQ